MEGAVAAGKFVDLCEGAFYEARSTADECDAPHPEDSTRAACYNSNRYAGNIADTYT